MFLNEIKQYSIVGAVFTLIAGILLHFVYEWTGGNNLIAIFGAVNESTWEHLKMLFWPIILFGVIEYFIYGKEYRNFASIKVLSALLGMATIVVLFYTYTGILGDNYLILDILVFIVGIVTAYIFSTKNLISQKKYSSDFWTKTSVLLLLLLIILFVLFTFLPPNIGLFRELTF